MTSHSHMDVQSGTQSLWLEAAASCPDASDFALDLARAILRSTRAVVLTSLPRGGLVFQVELLASYQGREVTTEDKR